MNPGHFASLIPEVFRHKNTRVRVVQPQVILLDFHGTISERKWEDQVVFPYVNRSIGKYIKDNWETDAIQRCVPGLKNESFEQRFRHKYDDAPIIDETDVEHPNQHEMAHQVAEFVKWQLSTRKVTRETHIIERLVWIDGFKNKHILTPLYDDVMPTIKKWREQYNCSIHVVSSVDSDTLKLLLENTEKGNLDILLSGYLGTQKVGEKLVSELYKQFYEKIRRNGASLSTREDSQSSSSRSVSGSHSQPKSPRSKSQTRIDDCHKSPSSLTSLSSEIASKPVLFITDSGQEAKAASQVADGHAYECLLINRPGNRRIRTYYLTQFQFIEKFDDIDFV